jgi:hypothetical protein
MQNILEIFSAALLPPTTKNIFYFLISKSIRHHVYAFTFAPASVVTETVISLNVKSFPFASPPYLTDLCESLAIIS